MYRYIDIASISKYANNELILNGAINASMIGGFEMFANCLFGLCAIALFMTIYNRLV